MTQSRTGCCSALNVFALSEQQLSSRSFEIMQLTGYLSCDEESVVFVLCIRVATVRSAAFVWDRLRSLNTMQESSPGETTYFFCSIDPKNIQKK